MFPSPADPGIVRVHPEREQSVSWEKVFFLYVCVCVKPREGEGDTACNLRVESVSGGVFLPFFALLLTKGFTFALLFQWSAA